MDAALWRDVRDAYRGLSRAPVFTAAGIASLTLGIATATTVFSLVDAAVLRPPPFPEADRLVILNITQETPSEGETRVRWSWRRFRLLQGMARSFEGIASSSNNVVTLTGVQDPEPVRVEVISPQYMSVLQAPLLLGRGFPEGEDEANGALVILGHDLWQRRFGGSRDVARRVVQFNGVALTVAGVASPGFTGVSGLAQAWIPAAIAPQVTYRDYLTTNQNFISAIGRLKPGVSVAAARAEMHTLGARIHAAEPSEADTPRDRFSATLLSLNQARRDVVTVRALALLSAAAGVLLLIACANVASLQLGRAASRRREMALRLAIGAGRGRLVRQLLVEGALLASISGAIGLLATVWAMAVVRIPPTLARGRNFYGAVGEFAEPAMDWRVLAFTIGVSAATILLFALVPALRATRTDLIADLKIGGARAGAATGRVGLRETIVAGQVALAIFLIVGCGLLLTSFARLRQTPLGFDPTRLLTFMIRPSEVRYPTTAAPMLLDRVLEEIERVPGVVSATVDGCAPLTVQCANATLHVVGRPEAADAPIVMRHYVAPAHFRTLGIPVLRGRGLTRDDRAGRPHVVVINQAAAQRFWPGEDPIGRRVWFDGAPPFASPESSAEIVGVVGNAAYRPLDEAPVQPGFFTSYAQFTYASRMVLVRTEGDPLSAVRGLAQAVRRADQDLALFDVQTMEQRASLSWAKHGAQSAVFLIIAAIALVLAIMGVYAVTSYFVTSRMRDLGVRIALGASNAAVVRASIGQTATLGILGGAAGLLASLALGRAVRAMLYETSAVDPIVYAGTVALMLLALLGASYFPVRRAMRIDPVEVLRSE